MYIPKHFEQPDVGVMQELITACPFSTLVTLGPNGLSANHVPMLLHKNPAPYGTLAGHVARANPVWREVRHDYDALVIFQGPDSYITPSWYPTKKETGRTVPTWNYVIVHAYGSLRVIDDPQWKRAHVEELTNRHESIFAEPWAVSDAPEDFIEAMLTGIVGTEISIERLVGKWKLGQNRLQPDRDGIISGLQNLGTPAALEMIDMIKRAGHT